MNNNSPQVAAKIDCTINLDTDLFIRQIDSLADTLPRAIRVIQTTNKSSEQELQDFFEHECTVSADDGKQKTYNVEGSKYFKFRRLEGRAKKSVLAQELVPRTFLVSLVSQFDAFLGNLIRQLFNLKPDAVDSSGITLTFSQLTEFGSVDNARNYIVDKEVEGYPATRLTQSRRRQAKGSSFDARIEDTLRPLRICRICGASIKKGQIYCASCAVGVSREGMIEAAKLGRIATHTLEAETLRAKTQRKHAAALKAWDASSLPGWLTEQAYRERILPCLREKTVSSISRALGVSEPYATDIRAGKRVPHARHWEILVNLVRAST